jgi:hypothetical protein
MAWAAAPLAIGGALIQGVAAIQQGNAQARAYAAQGEAKKQEDEIAAQNTKITAEQQQSARLDDLTRTIGTIRATVASRSLDLNSPSALALQGAATGYAQRDTSRIGFQGQQTAANYRLAGATAMATAQASGSLAKAAGWNSAIGSFFKAGTTAISAYGK